MQLNAFWTHLSRDFERGRIYIPEDSLSKFGVSEAQIRAGECTDNYRQLIRFEVDRTAALFDQAATRLDSAVGKANTVLAEVEAVRAADQSAAPAPAH